MAAKAKSAKEDKILPPVKDGEQATVASVKVVTRKTRPPNRYTEGTLIGDMEGAAKYVEDKEAGKLLKSVSGLGTGATRASIIEGLKRRQLLKPQGKYIVSTQKARELITALPEALYDIAETARWEAELDLIANDKASQIKFEDGIAERVEEHLKTLKGLEGKISSTKPNRPQSKRKGGKMSDSNNPPTDKMLSYAERLANTFNVEISDEVKGSFEKCREFIDKHASKPFPPSEKALNFANTIAERKGVEVPNDAKADAKKLSAWIDEHK